MEVILKKSKITNSILKQTQRSSMIDLNVSESLGWGMYDKAKYMVLYRSDLNSISRYLMFERIDLKFHATTNKYTAEVICGRYTPLCYEFTTESERDLFLKSINNRKESAKQKGQFFI